MFYDYEEENLNGNLVWYQCEVCGGEEQFGGFVEPVECPWCGNDMWIA